MKRRILTAIVAAALAAPSVASAERIQGRVVAADEGANKVTVERANPSTGRMERVDVGLGEDVNFLGVKSLEELNSGDEITVDARPDGAGFRASSVRLGSGEKVSGVVLPPGTDTGANPAAEALVSREGQFRSQDRVRTGRGPSITPGATGTTVSPATAPAATAAPNAAAGDSIPPSTVVRQGTLSGSSVPTGVTSPSGTRITSPGAGSAPDTPGTGGTSGNEGAS